MKFSRIILGFLLISAFFPLFSAANENTVEKPTLVLGIGEQRLIHIPGLLKYSLGSPVVRVLPLPKTMASSSLHSNFARESLLIKGVTPGVGDLWVWKNDGLSEHRTIRIYKPLNREQDSTLEKALGLLTETEIIYTGKGTVLRGTLHSLEETARVSALTQNFPQEIHNETEVSSELLDRGLIQLEKWLKTSGYSKKLRIEKRGDTLWVRGDGGQASEQSSLIRQIKSLFPPAQVELDILPDSSPTIYFRVFLVELKKSEFQSIGLSWAGVTPGAFHIAQGAFQELAQIDVTLQHLEGKGSAKILSNPELVVRAPGEAELFAGGEIPIQTQNKYFSNLTWKNYGLTLKLKVTHTAGDRVRLDIFTEVSHLDSSIGQDQVPGIQSNRMKTQVDARFGTPLLLSGLLQQGIREEARGLPFLRRIPVLGLLFGSEDYLNERSELVAILYPHSAPPPPSPEKLHLWLPRGRLPIPRNWISPEQTRFLEESPDYPWNALD